ncbi:BTB/POZ domain-containing protein 2-like [Mytilus californianus]|uniref:BTB/POZ domain-containing protein 2-like n=1 Tax=Mytilus californianus TaxID=6549 RepID=UPI002248605B|nr:BTB/POZ domain-containing protein 2-like [Mytilus californianus]
MAVCETQTGDWRDDKTLAECMRHMLKNEIMCDVTLRVGERRSPIKAHKYMLASRSPVFYTMFEGSMPETGEIDIPDIEENTFNVILVYIYTDKIEVSSSNLTELLYASDKYMLTKLKRECEKTLKRTATSHHAARALQTAYKYHLPDLLQESLQHMKLNTKECLLSEHALSLPKECIDMILKSDYLYCTETDICQFLLKWVKYQCDLQKIELTGQNMRNIVGQTLFKIRFPVVDMDFFSKEVANTELLLRDEIIAIYRSQYGIKTSIFSNSLRKVPIEKRQVHTVKRYTRYSQFRCNNEGTEALIFQADTEIWLKGVTLFFPPGSCTREITFNILDDITEEIYAHKEHVYGDYGGTERLFMFPKPVHVLARKEYTITTRNYTDHMRYGTGCNHSIKVSDCAASITFKNSPMCTGLSNIDQGQFAGFMFCV